MPKKRRTSQKPSPVAAVAGRGSAAKRSPTPTTRIIKTKPSSSCYREAAKHTAVSYQRLVQSLSQMQGCLASGYPFVFGFTVYESFETDTVARTGHVPMPLSGEHVLGGHAVCAVGYNTARRWFICRNSWGTSWGMRGYFTLPLGYLTNADLSADFWTIRVVE